MREAIRDGEKKQERDIGCVREEDAVARERDRDRRNHLLQFGRG